MNNSDTKEQLSGSGVTLPSGRLPHSTQGQALEVFTHGGRDYVSLTAYEELKNELAGVNKDLGELRRNKALLDSEVQEISKVREERLELNKQINDIALFFREHYKEEIALGQHLMFKSTADAVMYYLGRERTMTKQLGIVRPTGPAY